MTEITAPMLRESTPTASERERVYRRNFILFLSDYVIFSVALNLLGPTTVIPDFLRQLTDSDVLIGVSSQIFDAGWLLPQLLVARYLVGVANKKWWFVGPNIPVRTFILMLAGVTVLLGPERPGAILAAFLFFYALAALGDGLVGVPWVDLIGSSLDNRRRARMFGIGTALTGLLMIGLTPVIRAILGSDSLEFPNNYALVFALSGALFVITLPGELLIRELPGGAPQAKMPSMREYLPQLAAVLRHDLPYRAMIVTRVLVSFFTMAWPFYIGFATEQLEMSNEVAVSNLLLMQTLGSVTGALIFSWLGDRRTIKFIRFALLIGIFQPALALLASQVGPAPLYPAFVAAGLIQGTLTISFLNWLITYATPEQRPIYSGLFNTATAVSLLVAPAVGGLLVEGLGYEAVFLAALVVVSAALYVAVRHVPTPRDAAHTATQSSEPT
ncbi:MAG: MFS transporter [Chloroflexi bacterium]|nr:MFS transporter [Chloroflexota bacterium]